MTTALLPPQKFHVVATQPNQLQLANTQMIEWAEKFRGRLEQEIELEATNLTIAEENGWVTAPFKRRLNILRRRILFYEKIGDALRAGYMIVPNFTATMFAVRTEKETPASATVKLGRWNDFTQQPQLLAAGKGEYQNPNPLITTTQREVQKGERKEIEHSQWVEDDWEDIEFPLALAKPELMLATAAALKEKIFDEVGIVDDRSGDPFIVGRIRNPRKQHPAITFFIAWYFDPSRL